ncbi:hypothetical protein ABL78_3364 [Leptomonas seymouri]|uniref:AAA+ ATPase domain-containing protein n=1 Tax=Leptomonas seymouri TaxID=5684 RepID=A0A0N0P6U2_LEPSE|nr:hypothetical protein ABL78_3364 [Leptomonas seymouri]|eukprot:KPI87567.1 hypothetical protein ABL78_3364 [Leptomonas seymouri]
MYLSSLFPFRLSRGEREAPQGSALPSASTAAVESVSDGARGVRGFSGKTHLNAVPDTEAPYSLPRRRTNASGVSGLPCDASGPGSDKPSTLRELCSSISNSGRSAALSGYRTVCNSTAAMLRKAARAGEALHFPGWRVNHGGGDPFARCHWLYPSLATTRACSWVLPGVQDAPLVLHIAILFAGLEVIQATSFYIRYRRALCKSEEAFVEAVAAAEAAEETAVEEAENEDDEESVQGERAAACAEGSSMPARGATELSATRTARARLPRGSSRAMHRLCSYWGQIEKAVRQAPQKPAGRPTTAAQLGRFFGNDSFGEEKGECRNGKGVGGPASATPDGADMRFTSDGVPRGVERVLVLSDEHAFPLTHSSCDNTDSAATTATATVASSIDVKSLPAPAAHGNRGGVGLAFSSRMLPPMYPPPDATRRLRTSTPTPVTAAVMASEVAQPWQVLHCLWADTVRYSVNYTEIRQLLLGCSVAEIAKLYEDNDGHWGGSWSSRNGRGHAIRKLWRSVSRLSQLPSMEALPSVRDGQTDSPLNFSVGASSSAHRTAGPSSQPAAMLRYTDGRSSVVCMALVWYLSLVREVYEAVVVYEDVQRCADALDELEEYQRSVYQRGIEVGAEFFEGALRYAQDHSEELSVTINDSGLAGEQASNSPPRRLLLPQVECSEDTGHDVNMQRTSSLFYPLPSASFAHGDAQQQQRHGPPSFNPLDFDPVSFRNSPLPHHHDQGHCSITLRCASPRACWAELTAALAALLRRRRLMELACVRSLLFYMYAGSAAKIVSFSILALLTSLSSRVNALGQATREAISGNLDAYYRAAGQSGGGGEGGRGCDDSRKDIPVGPRILALFALECTRLAVNTVLAKTTSEYIALSASQRRNTVKAELYEALTRMPLAFFDLHAYEEVEQLVYYVNDIEGVEVHAHNYACTLVTSLFAMQHAMRQLPLRARGLVGVTVAASLGLRCIGQRVTCWTQAAQRTGGVLPPWLRGRGLDGTVPATAELDAQVEENTESSARQGGVMLRGLDIIAVLPQLRPYAADLRLMRWWTDHTRMCGAASGATEASTLAEGLLMVPRQLYGRMLPALGASVMTFADWVLPTLVSSYGASMAFSGAGALSLSNRLIEAMHCVGDFVDAVMDSRRVMEVVLMNAYKANALEKVLDQRRWEPTTTDFMRSGAYGVGKRTAEAGDDDAPRRHHQAEEEEDAPCATAGSDSPPDALRGGRRRVSGGAGKGVSRRSLHQQTLAKSLRSASVSRPSFRARFWKRLSSGAAWLVSHSPPVLMLHGTVYVLRGGLRWIGLTAKELPESSTRAGTCEDRESRLHRTRRDRFQRCLRDHHCRHDSQHHRFQPGQQRRQRATSSPGEAGGSGVVSPFASVDRRGSGTSTVSDANSTDAYDSNAPLNNARAESLWPSNSAVSYNGAVTAAFDPSSATDEEGAAGEVDRAAAAASALASATVHAVTVRSLQFYYPTAPTVPAFPKPITCAFTLQSEGWLSASPASPSSPSTSPSSVPPVVQLRGRLVCLVSPSGHGKSTLLSLLLGMYTHYGSPNYHNGGGSDAIASRSPVGWASDHTGESPMRSNSDEGDSLSFGSPQLADVAAMPDLPASILLTLHMTGASRRHSFGKENGSARGVSATSSFSSDTEIIEEQLPVSVIPRDILRGSLFSFVPQHPVIFSGATIAHNISLENCVSLGQEDLLAEVAQCAALAHCDFIQRFPQGLMTYIADSGTGAWSSPLASAAAGSGGAGGGGGMVRLSGGQAQRLMMARALFHGRRNGTVLVMDEPTASLDHQVKVGILEEWRELLDKGIVRGIICATHDADLISAADEVVRLP